MLSRFFNWLATFSPEYQQQRLNAARDRDVLVTYAAALRQIVITTDAVKVPNGTTQKLARIANDAFVNASSL